MFGVVRGSTEGLDLITLCRDFGAVVKIRVHLDASAAKGMFEREGIGLGEARGGRRIVDPRTTSTCTPPPDQSRRLREPS